MDLTIRELEAIIRALESSPAYLSGESVELILAQKFKTELHKVVAGYFNSEWN